MLRCIFYICYVPKTCCWKLTKALTPFALVLVFYTQKLELSHYTLSAPTVKYRPTTSGVLVVRTDGQENLWKAMSSVFSDTIHIRCDMHLKDNVKCKLSDLKLDSIAAREITHDIFGCTSDDVNEGIFIVNNYVTLLMMYIDFYVNN